jgi:hypothetical protein
MRTISELCRTYRVSGYFSDGNGYIGVRSKGLILWHYWKDGAYTQTGSTRTPQGARFHKL